jgi:Zn-dependent metalloprotease
MNPLLARRADTRAVSTLPEPSTPSGLLGVSSPEGVHAVETALAFLEQTTGLPDPRHAFGVRAITRDRLGMVHVRLDRVEGAASVVGGQVIVHLDSSGAARDFTGELPRLPASDLTPKVTLKEAGEGLRASANDPGAPLPWNETPEPGALGSGYSLYSGVVPLQTRRLPSGKYQLQDDTRGGTRTRDSVDGFTSFLTVFEDANNVWGEATDSPRVRAAVDAQYGSQMTWDFLKEVLGRNSWDDQGSGLRNMVHQSNTVQAYWNGAGVSFGDGDGNRSSALVSLDTVGHEIGHGVTIATADLALTGESGALNEAISDVYGVAVERYTSGRNPNLSWNYQAGEQYWTPAIPGDALRYMDDPRRDGGYSVDHYSRYSPRRDIHSTMGIANNAFYLIAEGGTHRTSGVSVAQGVGFDALIQIVYRAQAYYMTPTTTFAQARGAMVQAATDLYGAGSPQRRAVSEGWAAVGVHVRTPPASPESRAYVNRLLQLGLDDGRLTADDVQTLQAEFTDAADRSPLLRECIVANTEDLLDRSPGDFTQLTPEAEDLLKAWMARAEAENPDTSHTPVAFRTLIQTTFENDGVILADEVEQLERFAIADLTARRDAGEDVSFLGDSYLLAFDQIWIRANASSDPAIDAAREHLRQFRSS